MADRNIKGITVEIGGDTTGLDKALKDTETNSKKAASELRSIDRALKDAPQNAVLWQQKQVVLNKALEESKKKLKVLEDAQEQVNKQFEKGDITAEQYRAFQREVEKSKSEVGRLESQVENVNREIENLGKVSDDTAEGVQELGESAEDTADDVKQLGVDIASAGGKMEEIGGKIEGVGKKLIPVTAGITGIGTIAVKTAADFDSSMSQVAAVSGAAGEELEALRAKAREMGSQTKFSASEAGDAMNYMAMAGWKTNDMLSGIEGIMDLATASGEDLATTSDIVTDALTAFGMTAADSGHFADILAAASSNANTNVSMMGETFKYAAPVMGAMGYSAEDAAIAIGLMANAGIKSTQAGTSLRGILSNLAAPSDTVAAAMDKLGISLDDGAGNMLSFRELMVQLREGFGELKLSAEEYEKRESALNYQYENGLINQKKYAKGMQELAEDTFGAEGAIKAQAASSLAGKDSLSGLLAIVNASDEDFEKLTNAVDNCDGTSQKMAETMQDNLTGQLTVLKSQLEELAISGGEILMPAIQDIVGEIQNVVDWLNKLDPKTKETIVKTGLLAAAVGPLLIVLGKTTSGIGTLVKGIAKIPSALSSAGGMFQKVTGLATGLSSGVVGLVGALAVGAGSLVYAVYKAKQAKLEEIFEDAVQPSKDLAEATQANIDRYNELKSAATEQATADLTLIGNTQELYEKLKTIVDANGWVKKGYEEEAEYITHELKDATGIEMEIVDGRIDKYLELKDAIGKTIEMQRAQVFKDNYKETYESALTENQSIASDIGANMKQKTESEANFGRIEEAIKSRMVQDNLQYIFEEQVAEYGNLAIDNISEWTKYLTDEETALLNGAAESIKTCDETMITLKNKYDENNHTIEAYEKGEESFYNEAFEEAEKYYSEIDNFDQAMIASKKTQKEEKLSLIQEEVEKALWTYKGGLAAGDKNAKATFDQTMAGIAEKAKEGSITAGDIYNAGFLSKLEGISEFDASNLISYFGVVAGEAGSKFEGEIKPYINSVVSETAAAVNSLRSLNGVFGGSSAPKNVNSASDGLLRQSKMYAKGGIIPNGDWGIVAEAGPELLQLTNQGVQVTPLTQTARNHALSSVSSGDTYNQHITVNVQKISSDYDVRRTAQQMADELKRTRRGGGR